MEINKKTKAFDALTTNLAAKIIVNAVSALISILIIRLLSVKDFGIFSLFLSFLSLFGGLSLGIQHIYQRYIAAYVENKTDTPRVIKFTLVMMGWRLGIFFALLLIIYVLKLSNILNWGNFNFPYIYLAIIVCIFVISKFILSEGLISAYIDQKFYNLFDSAVTIMKAITIFIFTPSSVIIFIYIWLFFEIFRVIILFLRFLLFIRRDKFKTEIVNINRLEYKRYFNYGKYFILASMSSQILAFDIDNYFLSYFRNNEIVGIYSFATKIVFFLVGLAPANLLFNYVTPVIIKDYEKNKDKEKIKNAISTLFKLNIFIYSAMALFFCINIEVIIRIIFQENYLDAIPYIFALIIISFFPVIKNTFEPVARGIEKTRVYIFTFFAAIVNIIGNIILIPPLGISGAIIATGFSIAMQSTAFILFARKEIEFSFDYSFLINLGINLLPIIIIAFFLHAYLNQSFLHAIVLNIIFISLFILIFKIRKCFNDQEADFINSFLPKKVFIF